MQRRKRRVVKLAQIMWKLSTRKLIRFFWDILIAKIYCRKFPICSFVEPAVAVENILILIRNMNLFEKFVKLLNSTIYKKETSSVWKFLIPILLSEELSLEVKFSDWGGRGTGTGRHPGWGPGDLAQSLKLPLHHWVISPGGLWDVLAAEDDDEEADQGEEPQDPVLSHTLLQLGEDCPHSQHLEIGQSHSEAAHHNSHLKHIIITSSDHSFSSSARYVQGTRYKVHPRNNQYPVNSAVVSRNSGIFNILMSHLMTKVRGWWTFCFHTSSGLGSSTVPYILIENIYNK